MKYVTLTTPNSTAYIRKDAYIGFQVVIEDSDQFSAELFVFVKQGEPLRFPFTDSAAFYAAVDELKG